MMITFLTHIANPYHSMPQYFLTSKNGAPIIRQSQPIENKVLSKE